MKKEKNPIANALEIEAEISKKKIEAYDLLQQIYAAVARQKQLQQELAKVENDMAKLKQ